MRKPYPGAESFLRNATRSPPCAKPPRPFFGAGPAGKPLDRALDEAGIDRDATYVSNAVKHFQWREGASERIQARSDAAEIQAMATFHPSAILRQATDADRHRMMALLVADLEVAGRLLHDE
ncbi:MAG TPA: hypothetical protein VGM77_06745 [Gemmatimonadales bacterium]